MTYQELLDQITSSTGYNDGTFNQLGSSYVPSSVNEGFWENESNIGLYAQNMFNLLSGNTHGSDNWIEEAPSGTTWAGLGSSLNPLTSNQLLRAKYDTMRPQIAKGMSSLQTELLNNLSKVKTGGFESSGFADKQRAQARDIYGKKASDILVSEGTKRQDYMSGLIDQVMADRDLMSSWIDYEG